MLGLIVARGGSKRLAGKNTKSFFGKPLIACTIEVAKDSGVFERLIVVTDDLKIAEIAKEYGAEVPFMEPAELAGDATYVADALRYTLKKLEEDEKYSPSSFILLEASSVGREARHIQEVAEILTIRTDFDSLVGISEVPGHFSYLKQLDLSVNGMVGRVGDGVPLKELTHHNQDIAKSYYINSAIYGFRCKNLFERDRNLWGESTYGYVMKDTALADIDTPEDWLVAEAKLKESFDNK